MIRLVYVVVVAAPCVLSPDKNECNKECCVCYGGVENGKGCLKSLTGSN